ncbi:FAD-binding oxidoreductase [Frigidibacter sp. MR17.14]|uniref:FAD-binding oxidoreductase n=1 Tax=Frigidibacter sp. MR17.14 TaxID=3126509 RepID=UPI003012B527
MTAPVTPAFLESLAARLPEGVLSEAEPRHLEEPRGRVKGRPGPLARPRTVEEVSVILAACHEAGVGVVPWGGGTGLVGGQVTDAGPLPLILSLERMAAVRAVHPEENVLVIEAGATLAAAQEAAASAGRLFPLSLAAQGTATIGGNLGTNAGGVNVLRWGNARELCLGIEAVLADGTIIRNLRRLRKDNTGYDIRDLLIGAEGTLGVITAAALKLVMPPVETGTAVLTVRDPQAALDLLTLSQTLATGMVSAFELISGTSFAFMAETQPQVRAPLRGTPDWAVLIELGLPAGFAAADMLGMIFETGMEAGLVTDGVIASSVEQRHAFWAFREHIPEANRAIGAVSSHDVSLPLSRIPEFIGTAQTALAEMGDFRVNCFGHLGDGNLHFNAFPAAGRHKSEYEGQRRAVMDRVHDIVDAMEGSFSAEHGIGRLKVADLERYGDPGRLVAMRAVKAALDPKGILNPGVVLA